MKFFGIVGADQTLQHQSTQELIRIRI